jgi:hypothetical protein
MRGMRDSEERLIGVLQKIATCGRRALFAGRGWLWFQ